MESLRQLVYASAATRSLRDPELLAIVEAARARNAELDVTGMLLYAEGAFVQVLEGEPKTVEKLLRRIRRDERHRRFLILLDRMTDERAFEGWSMGFQQVTLQEIDQIAGYYDWSVEMPTRRRNAAALRLIDSFRRVAALR